MRRDQNTHILPQSSTFRLVALACMLCSAIACNRPALLLEANANHLRTARTVAAAFHQIHGSEIGLSDVPFVTLGVESGQGYSYDIDHNVLFVTPFEQADFDTQKIFAKASADSRAKDTYSDLMFRFFTAHQLMHLVYDQLPLSESNDYVEETRINTMTWLFLEQAGLVSPDQAEIDTLLTDLTTQLEKRFPTIVKGEHHAEDLAVEDNASYWYVTATSLLESQRYATRTGSTTNYLSSLVGNTASATTVR